MKFIDSVWLSWHDKMSKKSDLPVLHFKLFYAAKNAKNNKILTTDTIKYISACYPSMFGIILTGSYQVL